MFVRPWKNLRASAYIRTYASKATVQAPNIRNIALVAHIDSGKTTLTESILYSSSYLSVAGSVDTGSTTTDFLPAERERGITIQSASIPVKWKKWTFNLVDTPGHADFGMEVESASRVVDGAVVLIDSVEGVESQTNGVWKQLDRYGVPTRMIFLNKLDRPGASFRHSMLSLLTNRLHPAPLALTIPIASFSPEHYPRAEPGIEGLVDIFPDSHPIVPHLIPARMALLDSLAMFSDRLMEKLLESPSYYLRIELLAVLTYLRKAVTTKKVLPVLCGSALKNIGTELVMDYVGELLASPLDVQTGATTINKLVMLAWKVTWDKQKGWMTFVRVYSGMLKRQTVVLNKTRGKRERVSKLLLLYASQTEEVDTLLFGSVGVVLGLKETRTGDTLTSSHGATSEDSLRDIIPPPAVMAASVMPQSQSDLKPLQKALDILARTDPSVRVETQEGQTLVHGMGALHLEIIEGRLRDEWGARFEFGKRRISYREGLGPLVNSRPGVWSTEVSGKKADVTIRLFIRRLSDDEEGDPIWDGNIVLDRMRQPLGSPESFPEHYSPMAQIARGVASALSNSPHTSLAFSNIYVAILGYDIRPDVTTELLASATAVILRERLQEAGPGPIMEPYVRVKVSVNEDILGKVVKDLTEHDGEVLDLGSGSGSSAHGDGDYLGPYPEDGIYIPPDWLSPSMGPRQSSGHGEGSSPKRSVHAVAPLARMLDYSNRLRALSGGHGTFEMSNADFRRVPLLRRQEILKEIGRA